MIRRGALVIASSLLAACVVERDLGSTMTADASTPAAPRDGSIVFVTEGRFTGDLAKEGGASDGRLGGDELCALEARGAGLAGTFQAWLAIGTSEPEGRLGAAGPYRRVDGKTVFPGKAPAGAPLVPVAVTAGGSVLTARDDGAVWVGAPGRGCASFASGAATSTGAIGSALAIDATWTADGNAVRGCNERARLYCFQR